MQERFPLAAAGAVCDAYRAGALGTMLQGQMMSTFLPSVIGADNGLVLVRAL